MNNSKFYSLVIYIFFATILSSCIYYNEAIAQEEISSNAWWNSKWKFRIPVLITNSINQTVEDFPLFFYLEIPDTHLISAERELRLIDELGIEIPSSILYEYQENSFTRGVYAVTFVSQLPEEARIVYAYFGNPESSTPEYRSTQVTSSANSEFSEALLKNPVFSGSEFELLYGSSYPSTISTLMNFETQKKRSFGPANIADERFEVIRSWRNLGDFSIFDTRGASVVLNAEGLVLVRSIINQGSNTWIADLLLNEQTTTMNNVNYYFLMNASGMISQGIPDGEFSPISSIARINVGGAYIMMKSRSSVDSYQVSNNPSLTENLLDDSLDNSRNASGLFTFALNQRIELLKRGEYMENMHFISIDSNSSKLVLRLESMIDLVKMYILPEESIVTPIPIATAGYETEILINNVTISPDIFPLNFEGRGYLAEPIDIQGEASYEVLDEEAENFDVSNTWITESFSRTGNLIASSNYWHDPEKGSVGLISIWDETNLFESNASLTTSWIRVPSITSAKLNFSYRANIEIEEESSIPKMFVSINIDSDLDSVSDKAIFLSVIGAETFFNSPISYFLKSDGIWRNEVIDITELLTGENQQVSIEIFASTSPGFTGSLQFAFDNIQILATGNADELLDVSIDETGKNILLSSKNEYQAITVSDEVLLLIPSYETKSMNPLSGYIFESRFEAPPIQISDPPSFVKGVIYSHKNLFIWSKYLDDMLSLMIQDTLLGLNDYDIIEKALIIRDDQLNPFQSDQLKIEIEYIYDELKIDLKDAKGRPLPDALVVIKDNFGIRIISDTTAEVGEVTFKIISSDYIIQTYYHGLMLSERFERISSDSDIELALQIYQIQFKILDQLGFPINGASIQLATNNGTIIRTEETDSDGDSDFIKVVGKSRYEIMIYVDGEQILKEPINPSINDITMILNTPHLPLLYIIIIGSLLIGLSLIIIIAMRNRIPRLRARPNIPQVSGK
jgi:hypothetical protein